MVGLGSLFLPTHLSLAWLPSSSSCGGSPQPSPSSGGLPSLPFGGGSHSTLSGWAFAPSSSQAGSSPPPPFPVGSQPTLPFGGGFSSLPSGGRPAPPSGGVTGRVLVSGDPWLGCVLGGSVVRRCVVGCWVGWLGVCLGGWARLGGECRGVRSSRFL